MGLSIIQIAKIVNATAQAFSVVVEGIVRVSWEDLPAGQKASMANGVRLRLQNLNAPVSAQHDAYVRELKSEGWERGPELDVVNKKSPIIAPFNEVSTELQQRWALVCGVVSALAPFCDDPHHVDSGELIDPEPGPESGQELPKTGKEKR